MSVVSCRLVFVQSFSDSGPSTRVLQAVCSNSGNLTVGARLLLSRLVVKSARWKSRGSSRAIQNHRSELCYSHAGKGDSHGARQPLFCLIAYQHQGRRRIEISTTWTAERYPNPNSKTVAITFRASSYSSQIFTTRKIRLDFVSKNGLLEKAAIVPGTALSGLPRKASFCPAR